MTAVRAIFVSLFCLVMLGPIVVVVVVSFSGDAYLAFPPRTFSIQWYDRFLSDPQWRAALVNSIVAAAICSLIATTTGFMAAYAFARGRLSSRPFLIAVALMPLIMPSIVNAIAIYFLSVKLGLVGNRMWLAMTHAVMALPVVLIIAEAALRAFDPALERAAMVHGCTRLGVFRRVVAPIVAPSIFSGALFAFLASFDELLLALFVSGVDAQTLPVRIWNSLTLELEPTIAAVSAVLIFITVGALLLDASLRALASSTRSRQKATSSNGHSKQLYGMT
jgi:ABC-type spermidine/putrescine transport system permease subunit II